MPLTVQVDTDGSISVVYDVEWLSQLMRVSSWSMVPFSFFAPGGGLSEPRSYPRSVRAPFTLGERDAPDGAAASGAGIPVESDAPAAGGRRRVVGTSVPKLCEAIGTSLAGCPIPLSDIAIMAKRDLCARLAGLRLSNFEVLGGRLSERSVTTNFPVHGYPMLCIMLKPGTATRLSATQGVARVLQCVFGAMLTQSLRAAGLGLEVVSREGFGSMFPTLADLPAVSGLGLGPGIRLDPGLLPPDRGAAAVERALGILDAFVARIRDDVLARIASTVRNLTGMGATELAAVDVLMEQMLRVAPRSTPTAAAADGARRGGKAQAVAPVGREDIALVADAYISSLASRAADARSQQPDIAGFPPVQFSLRAPGAAVRRRVGAGAVGGAAASAALSSSAVASPAQGLRRRVASGEDGPYGSDSECEDGPTAGAAAASATSDGDAAVGTPDGSFAIRKASVVSGMAALRMATFYAMSYSAWLFNQGGASGEAATKAIDPLSWAPYFELDLTNLYALMPGASRAGVKVFVFDGAPNPINVLEPPPTVPSGLGAVVVDCTNNTTQEKAGYVRHFCERGRLASQGGSGCGGLLILVESASKHPTGGDLVHGVMRVCGPRRSVDEFFTQFLLPHLGRGRSHDQTVLGPEETQDRRAMLGARLVMRNRDLWNALQRD